MEAFSDMAAFSDKEAFSEEDLGKESPSADLSIWSVYLIECGDGSYYCGTSNDVERRFIQHSEGCGAKYTRARGPLKLVYIEVVGTRSAACKREYVLRKLPKQRKVALAKAYQEGLV